MILYLRILALLFLSCVVCVAILSKSIKYLYLVLFLGSIVLHGVAVIADVGIPVALLYGPLIYLTIKDYRSKGTSQVELLWQALPFLFFSLWYVILHTSLYFGWQTDDVLKSYYLAYFFAMPVSLIGYGAWCLRRPDGKSSRLEVLADQLSMISIIAGLLILGIFGDRLAGLPELGFNLQWIVLALLFSSALLIVRFFFFIYKRKGRKKNKELEKWEEPVLIPLEQRLKMYKGVMPDLDLLAGYEKQLKEFFDSSKVFLTPGLTAGMVAAELGISKHHFSVLLNVYIGRNFYNFVAYYRIAYAMELIVSQESAFSIEALASECGFNSKTSFNRYFREFTGFTPSEFKAHLDFPDMEVPS